MVGTIAPTVRPIADAAKDSVVTIPQNFPNLETKVSEFHNLVIIKTQLIHFFYSLWMGDKVKLYHPVKSSLLQNIMKRRVPQVRGKGKFTD